MACNICGSKSFSSLFEAKDYEHGVPGRWTTARCDSCGLLTQYPLPRESEIGGFYPPSYSAYNSNTIISWLFRRVYAQDARRIARMVGPSGRILDVGCGNGSALMAMRKLGEWDLHGLEFDATAAQQARNAGLDVRSGELLHADFADNMFDLIRMGHVIEHVLDPMATFRRAFSLLKPGGVLFGETPNTDCLDFRIFQQYWGALHIPRHIMMFDHRNLRTALEQTGFERVTLGSGLRTVGWSAGVQNLLVDKFGLRVPPTGRVSWYSLLIMVFLPLTCVQALTAKTATVSFVARKPSNIPALPAA